MSRALFTFFLSVLFIWVCAAQEIVQETTTDSLKLDLKKEGIVVQDTIFEKKKRINPLAPSKAAFYSAVLPGLGQVYNKKYWKVPIVIGIIGSSVYMYKYNDDLYDRFRTAFKSRKAGFLNDEFYDPNNELPTPDYSIEILEKKQEDFQRDRDLALVVTIAMYALNIIDANVDSHLKQFNIDEDLSMKMQPYLDLNPITNDPNYGIAFTIKF